MLAVVRLMSVDRCLPRFGHAFDSTRFFQREEIEHAQCQNAAGHYVGHSRPLGESGMSPLHCIGQLLGHRVNGLRLLPFLPFARHACPLRRSLACNSQVERTVTDRNG